MTMPAIDYTSKDFEGFKSSLLAYANQVMPDWNTSSEGDFGILMVELFSYAGDILSYYGDRISQEAYLPTATQRVSLLNISDLLGYVPSNGTPSTGTVTFQTDNPGVAITVPALTQIATNYVDSLDAPVIFETDQDLLVPANGGEATVTVTQGETQTMVTLGLSDGTPGQEMIIPQLNVIDGTVDIFVETTLGNEVWTEIQFLVDAAPTDKVYSVRTNEVGATIVTFGDNLNGLIPPLGMTVWTTYRIGVGSAGNTPAGTVGTIVSPNVDGVTVPVQSDGTFLSSAMIGASDPETTEQIRANAPLAFRTQFRAVSLQDFEDLAQSVAGVSLAHAVAAHYTSVTLYVLGPNGQAPSSTLIENILDFFQDKTLSGVSLSILGPTLIPVNIGSTASPILLNVKDRYSRPAVVTNVTTALQNLLAVPNISFGQHLSVSDIYHCIMSVDGVDYVYVPVFARADASQSGTADIQFRDAELPTPGTIQINASGGIS